MSTGVRESKCPVVGAGAYADQGSTAQGSTAGADVRADAAAFFRLLESEGVAGEPGRAGRVLAEIEERGTYTQSPEELLRGARIAWRNTPRCIGKFYWKALAVRDMRHLTSAQEVYEAVVEHLRLAFANGKVKLLMTVFAPREPGRPGIRIWNPQLVRYAGHREADGRVVGDPETTEFTAAVRALGWNGGSGGRFDVLPLVIQMPGQCPRLFELPPDVVHEVPLTHPRFPWFADLGLKWHAFPSISDQSLQIGGVEYTAAPFSAWYSAAEIGARNMADTNRYDMLPAVARGMGLDMSSDRTLWKDRALVELTQAAMHSFDLAGISIVDHHFATKQFVRHEQREEQAGRPTHANWELIVPAVGGPATPVWQRRYQPTVLRPNFYPQPAPWVVEA